MSRSAPSSRPSKTNPADHGKDHEPASLRGALSEPLTDRDGVTLRSEALRETTDGTEARDWRDVTGRWRRYIEDSRETAAVFENASGDRTRGGDPNRFMEGYANKQYAKLKDLERGVRAEYGKRLHSVMLTLTASPTDDDGDHIPPADHLEGPEGLLSSWQAASRALRRSMKNRRYERLAILEPHQSGYLHVHIAVFVEGVVRPEQFRPVIEAHLRNCDRAGREAHRVDPDDPEQRSAVSVRHVGDDRSEDEIANLGTYLAEYLGTYDGDPLDQPDHVQAANAVLWATGRRRWRPSQGAQRYMATNRGGDGGEFTEWEFIGIEDGEGELHECPPGDGVDRGTTWSVGSGRPPPD